MNEMSGPQDREKGYSKRRHLPSLGSFATFEVAAKHLSFTLTAGELNVTQAAVSQQIRALENALNCQLFLRKHNALELTPEGEALAGAVAQGLDVLSDAIHRIGRPVERDVLTIAGTHSGIAHFVKPIADRFQDAHPDICFTLLASDENDRLKDFEEVDIAVICGNERSAVGPNLIYLFEEVVEPVCSPDFLSRHGPIDTAEHLASVPLMELHRMHWSSDAIAWHPLTWADWFRQHAPDVPPPAPQFVTNSYGALIDSALQGRGVTLGWRHLVADQLAKGSLVPFYGHSLNAGRSYFLKVNPRRRDGDHAERFVQFLLAEISEWQGAQ